MTPYNTQIQTLIDAIDTVLQQGKAVSPWTASAQVSRQRKVLQQVRQYFQQSLSQAVNLAPSDPIEELEQQWNEPQTHSSTDNAQATMQSVVQEINELRTGVLRPLHVEVANLMQQRSVLLQEIRQLETRQQNDVLASLTQPQASNSAYPTEKLQGVQDQADQVLKTLDTTLRVVFESLQRDIQAYQDSLSQGIDKMHLLGRQSEAMFSGLVSRLASSLQAIDAATTDVASPSMAPKFNSRETPHASEGMEPLPPSNASDTITTLTALLDQLAPNQDRIPSALSRSSPNNSALDEFAVILPENCSTYHLEQSPERSAFAQPLNSLRSTAANEKVDHVNEKVDHGLDETRLVADATLTQSDVDQQLDKTAHAQFVEELSRFEASNSFDLSNASRSFTYPPVAERDTSESFSTKIHKIQSVFNLEGIDDLFIEESLDPEI